MLIGLAVLAVLQGDPEELRKSLKDLDAGPGWVYNDVDAGFAEAKRTGKPLLVVFR